MGHFLSPVNGTRIIYNYFIAHKGKATLTDATAWTEHDEFMMSVEIYEILCPHSLLLS